MKNKINWLALGAILFMLLIIGSCSRLTYLDLKKNIDYCHKNNFDGFSDETYPYRYPNDCMRCFRDIPSMTGLGIETEYSGCID